MILPGRISDRVMVYSGCTTRSLKFQTPPLLLISRWSHEVQQKNWARSAKPFWRLLDTNKQTPCISCPGSGSFSTASSGLLSFQVLCLDWENWEQLAHRLINHPLILTFFISSSFHIYWWFACWFLYDLSCFLCNHSCFLCYLSYFSGVNNLSGAGGLTEVVPGSGRSSFG